MVDYFDEPIIGYPYPVAAGPEYGYRVFDGKKWHDCDENGRITE